MEEGKQEADEIIEKQASSEKYNNDVTSKTSQKINEELEATSLHHSPSTSNFESDAKEAVEQGIALKDKCSSVPEDMTPKNEEECKEESSLRSDDEEPPTKKPKALPMAATDAMIAEGIPTESSNDEETSYGIDVEPSTAWSTKLLQTGTHAQASNTLFVGNLSFSVEQEDVEFFFKDAGEISEIRFALDREGIFKGYAHIEFSNSEGAQKAIALHGRELLGRRLKIDWATEKGVSNRRLENSFQGDRSRWRRIFVRGFDKNDGEEKIRGALEEHFKFCGEIYRVSIPTDSDGVQGIAFIEFSDNAGFCNALKLDGSELGTRVLTVEAAKCKRYSFENYYNERGGSRFGHRHFDGWGYGDVRGGHGRYS